MYVWTHADGRSVEQDNVVICRIAPLDGWQVVRDYLVERPLRFTPPAMDVRPLQPVVEPE